jgi:hypothetical protein
MSDAIISNARSAAAETSERGQSPADGARTEHQLGQMALDGSLSPMPLHRTQCADLQGWTGEANALGWRKVGALGRGKVSASVGEPVSRPTNPMLCAKSLAAPNKRPTAVPPFAKLTVDAAQEYLSDRTVQDAFTEFQRSAAL